MNRDAEKISREFESAKANMNILMEVCNDLSELAPPGFREYIAYNVEAFKAADKAMKIISRHTSKLANAAEQAEKEWESKLNNPNNIINIRLQLRKDTQNNGAEKGIL